MGIRCCLLWLSTVFLIPISAQSALADELFSTQDTSVSVGDRAGTLENKAEKQVSLSSVGQKINISKSAADLLPQEYFFAREDLEININEVDRPPPLPDEFEIDESGGNFPLGIIRPIPVLELQLNSSIFSNSYAGATLPNEDTIFLNTAAVRASPELGVNTRLAAGVQGGFARFASGDGYNSLVTDLGVIQELGDNMSLGLGWGYRQIYGINNTEDLTEHSVRLNWSRLDQLDRKLFLKSDYELRANFAIGSDVDRVTNSIGIGLNYSFTPELQGLVGYRLIYNDFTRDDLLTTAHQLGAQLSYHFDRNIFIGSSISYLFGETANLLDNNNPQERDLNNLSLGFHVGFNVPLLF